MPKARAPVREWQQQLIDDYYNYRWNQLLEPLYQDFQRWKAGERSHADMSAAIHAKHVESRHLYSFFLESRDTLASFIQNDRDWFEPWLAEHPAPPGVRLIPFAAK